MCGYIDDDREKPGSFRLFSERYISRVGDSKSLRRYYPAFGQDPERKIDLIIEEDNELKSVQATWWYDCFDSPSGFTVGRNTTFNARALEKPYWQEPLHNGRGIVIATGIGESKLVGKTKHQYYMQSKEPFVLGALYKKHQSGHYSCAVITRDAHPKMESYHDKAFPCFLPPEPEFIKLWLSKDIQNHSEIDFVLAHPALYPTLKVQRVKTYKDKVPLKSFEPVILNSDLE
jgi:putative SOS response-associated peptidase YedK